MTVLLSGENSKPAAGGASRFLLFDAGFLFRTPPMQETPRYHQHAPWRAVAKDATDLALKFHGTAAELCTEFAGERSQTFVANFEAYFGDSAFRSQHLFGAVHA